MYIYTHHIIFIHSSVDGHLGILYILAVIYNASVNIGVHVSFWISVLCVCVYKYVYGASLVAQLVKDLHAMQETQVRFLGWEEPLEKG